MLIVALALMITQPARTADWSSPIERTAIVADERRTLAAYDRDGNGRLSVPEWLASIGMSPTSSREIRGAALRNFRRMHANRDGQMSLTDLLREPLARFDCYDRNHDRRLSEREMEAGIDRCSVRRAPWLGLPPRRAAARTAP